MYSVQIKVFLLIIFATVFSESTNAKTYYISSTLGNDQHSPLQAQNEFTPWKTINQVNSFKNFLPGDSVLFRRGETFFGTIRINTSGSSGKPIVYSAYGVGEQPIITSLVSIVKWNARGNGIYESEVNLIGQDLNIVLIKGIIREMGRYPNRIEADSGYLTLESHSANTSISDYQLSSSQNWTGAELVVRKNHWIIDRHKITSQSGTQINYNKGNSIYNPTDNFGYFIQNHIKTLDEFGEWYYDVLTKKISVYFGQYSPNQIDVKVACLDNLVFSPQKSGVNMFVVFDQLKFYGANASSILFNSGNYFTVKNCSIECSGDSGIQANGVEHLTVTNCSISKSCNNGIVSIYNNPYSVINSNKIDSTYIFPGMGRSGDGNGIALYCIGQNSRVEKNKITNTGYSGVYFGGDSVLIKNNFIDRFCLVKDDGSGIYTFTGSENRDYSGRRITGNIILNGIGAIHGSEPNYAPAEGIYIDDNASGINISDNTVANMSNYGIYFHNSRNIKLKNNLVFDCNTQLAIRHDQYGGEIKNLEIYNNIFFSKKPAQKLSLITTEKNDLKQMMVLDSNFYDRPIYSDGIYISTKSQDNTKEIPFDYDLETWKADLKQDLASQKSVAYVPEYHHSTLSGKNKFPNGTFDISINNVESYSPSNQIKTAWVKDNNSNGFLQVKSSDLSYLILPVGIADKNRKYILSFDMIANRSSLVNIYVRQLNYPYKTISLNKSFKSYTTNKSFEILIEPLENEDNSCIIFETKDKDFLYNLDNFNLSEANVELSDPDEYVKFFYNFSSDRKKLKISDSYYDARNIIHTSEVFLEPYSSTVLIKSNLLVPNPPILSADDHSDILSANHKLGAAEIVVSENGQPYIPYYGQIIVGNVDRKPGYWKFKVKNGDGYTESAIVESPEFTSVTSSGNKIKIFPNPVASEANVYILNSEIGQCTISIYSLKGLKMQESKSFKDSYEKVTALNIRNLPTGIYMVLIRINNKTFLQKIFKI